MKGEKSYLFSNQQVKDKEKFYWEKDLKRLC